MTYFGEAIKSEQKIGSLDQDKVQITYTNIKNEECLIMSLHLLHRTDLSRTDNFKGFNFRVLLRKNDGSIPHKYKYTHRKPYHRYDDVNRTLHNCEILDFA